MKIWMWIAIAVSVLGLGIFAWSRKQKVAGNDDQNTNPQKQGILSLPKKETQVPASPKTPASPQLTDPNLDVDKRLVRSCIATVCPQSAETAQLQQKLNDYLPRMNSILANDTLAANDREKGIKSRFDKLFVDGKLKLKFRTGINQISPLEVDGRFGEKTEQMLFLITGKKETSINSIDIALFSDNNPQAVYSLV